MKKLTMIFAFLGIATFYSCSDDSPQATVTPDPVAAAISAPADGATVEITDANLTDNLTITWSAADYGADMAVSYDVQIDVKGNLFDSPSVLATTTETTVSIAYADLNTALKSDLGMEANTSGAIELRIVSSATGVATLNSDVVGLTVTPYASSTMEAAVVTVGAELQITADNISDAYEVSWTAANFGMDGDINYTVLMAIAGEGIDKAVQLGKTTDLTYSVTNEALNFYLDVNLAQDPNVAVSVEFFVSSDLAGTTLDSDASAASITTMNASYGSDVIYMTGSFQDPQWQPWTNPTILIPFSLNDFTGFEGFYYFNGAQELKFTNQPGWDGTNFAYDSDGVMTTTGTDNIPVSGGHYQVLVDTVNLTYAFNEVQWGIIGDATPGGWDSSTPMTYNEDDNTWSITLDLVLGSFKFRANDSWDINLGPRDSYSHRGELINTGDNIDSSKPGNYTVILRFDDSTSPYRWNYEVIEN